MEIGSWVKWADISPTRLGYAASDIGKVVGVQRCEGKTLQIDVQFDDGDTVRGAFEPWFERVHERFALGAPVEGEF